MNSSVSTLWWSDLSRQLPVNFRDGAVGGSRYVQTNPADPGDTFLTRVSGTDSRVQAASLADVDAVIFFGSLNDENEPAGTIYAHALAAFQVVRKDNPQATLVVVGPQWMKPDPPAAELANSQAVHRAATQVSATWVDPLALKWFDRALPNPLIGSDGVHPTDAGHEYLASLMKAIVERAIAGAHN